MRHGKSWRNHRKRPSWTSTKKGPGRWEEGTHSWRSGFCVEGATLGRRAPYVSAECLRYEWRGPRPWASVCLPTWREEIPFSHHHTIFPPPEGHIEGQASCLSKCDTVYLYHMSGQTFPVAHLDLLGLVVSFPFLHFFCMKYLSCLSLIDK